MKENKILPGLENLIMVTPELKSFKSKVGGLGDVAEELSKVLADLGIKVTVVSILYKKTRKEVEEDGKIDIKIFDLDYSDLQIEDTGKEVEVEVAGEKVVTKIKKSKIGKADVIFLENEKYGDLVYGGDLLKQAIFIGRGTLEALKIMGIKPTIIHMHDGLTGLVTFLRTDERYYKDPFLNKAKLVFTVHNAGYAYQQIFDSSRFDELEISRIHWDGLVWEGKINLTYAGLFHSQKCNTVSKDYANTLRSKGEGLGPMFRKKDIIGIINGIDVEYWKIKRDKREAKLDLIRTMKKYGANLDPNKFTIVIPRRISYQKGWDVVIKILRELVRDREEGGLGAQFIVLGRAHEKDTLGQEWARELKRVEE
ncbi:MAG: glycogen/starch synthase [Candidatus Aenigmatarchaeota archaeon]